MLLLALGTLALLLSLVSPRAGGGMGGGSVYSVAVLRAFLARRPAAWLDRPLRVRAIADPCGTWLGPTHESPCLDPGPSLVDPGPGVEPLPLTLGGASPLLVFLRRLPLLGPLVAAPQRLRWGATAEYRIELRCLSCGLALSSPCYQAVLLDADPGSAPEAVGAMRWRPSLIKLLDTGEIPHLMTEGGHRRIRFVAVLTYQRRRSAARREALREIAAIGEAYGAYDLDESP